MRPPPLNYKRRLLQTRSYYHYDHLGTIVAVTGSWMDASEAVNPYLESEGLVQRYSEACPAEGK